MAVTSIWPIKGRVDKVINYARNPEKTHDKEKLSELHEIEGVVEYAADEMKTEKRAYVTCLHLHSEETAAQEFMETKRLMHNEGGRSCYHGYQSFKADEVDADTAHSIGVALARELWGDRFQVVIATHCNTGHYHNHFVINSVSDVDGKKFYNSPADYRRMREVSDRLCREAKISVIEYPADRRANYGEWLAEKNGKPTMRSRIREDIDRAILASTTEREFLRVMKEMGYEVITKTPKGSPRVHPIVRIVDGGRNFRLDKLGEYYELDSIKQRIQNNYRRKTPFPEVAEDTKAPYYQYKEKAKKATGLYALYLYYCYMLDNRYALLFIRGERPIRDLKYDILHHPNVALTTDGSAPAYTHGEDTRSIASMAFSFDKKAVKNAEKMEAEKHEFLLYSEEELEELLDEKEKKGNEET